MVLNTTQQQLIKIAAILGIVQSLAWIAMSLTAIIIHFQDELYYLYSINSFEQINNFLLRFLYINQNVYIYMFGYDLATRIYLDFIIGPTAFCIFMFIYLFSNLCWLFISVVLFRTIKKMDFKKLEKRTLAWTLITIGICTIDFILVCCLGRDYSKCSFLFCQPIGIVLTLAAKGFVLWFINLIFAVVLRMYSVEIARARKNPTYNQNVGQLQNQPLYQIPQAPNGFNSPTYVQFMPMNPQYVQIPSQTMVPVMQQGIPQQNIPQGITVPQPQSLPANHSQPFY